MTMHTQYFPAQEHKCAQFPTALHASLDEEDLFHSDQDTHFPQHYNTIATMNDNNEEHLTCPTTTSPSTSTQLSTIISLLYDNPRAAHMPTHSWDNTDSDTDADQDVDSPDAPTPLLLSPTALTRTRFETLHGVTRHLDEMSSNSQTDSFMEEFPEKAYGSQHNLDENPVANDMDNTLDSDWSNQFHGRLELPPLTRTSTTSSSSSSSTDITTRALSPALTAITALTKTMTEEALPPSSTYDATTMFNFEPNMMSSAPSATFSSTGLRQQGQTSQSGLPNLDIGHDHPMQFSEHTIRSPGFRGASVGLPYDDIQHHPTSTLASTRTLTSSSSSSSNTPQDHINIGAMLQAEGIPIHAIGKQQQGKMLRKQSKKSKRKIKTEPKSGAISRRRAMSMTVHGETPAKAPRKSFCSQLYTTTSPTIASQQCLGIPQAHQQSMPPVSLPGQERRSDTNATVPTTLDSKNGPFNVNQTSVATTNSTSTSTTPQTTLMQGHQQSSHIYLLNQAADQQAASIVCPVCEGVGRNSTKRICGVCYSGLYNDITKIARVGVKIPKEFGEETRCTILTDVLRKHPRGCKRGCRCPREAWRFDTLPAVKCTRCRSLNVVREVPSLAAKIMDTLMFPHPTEHSDSPKSNGNNGIKKNNGTAMVNGTTTPITTATTTTTTTNTITVKSKAS